MAKEFMAQEWLFDRHGAPGILETYADSSKHSHHPPEFVRQWQLQSRVMSRAATNYNWRLSDVRSTYRYPYWLA